MHIKHFNLMKSICATLFLFVLAGGMLWSAEPDSLSDDRSVPKHLDRETPVKQLQDATPVVEIKDKSVLKAHEMIAVEISPQKELSVEREIDEKGEIVFPYLQNVKVAGLTPLELSQRLTDELSAKYLKNPSVMVRRLSRVDAVARGEGGANLGEGLSKPVVIFGQIRKPAPFYLKRAGALLSEVIAASDGFTSEAAVEKIKLIRNKMGRQEVEIINMLDIFSGKAQDAVLDGGDIVMVPSKINSVDGVPSKIERFQGDDNMIRQTIVPIKVFGAVNEPGTHYPLRDNVTLAEVIALQKGLTPDADATAVRIIRIPEKKEHQMNSSVVNFQDIISGKASDLVLQQGDVVVVPVQQLAVNIIGEVEKPGLIATNQLINQKMTLMRVIALAGGFKKSAALWRVRIVRVVNGKEHSQRVNVKKILKGKRKDIVLELGDLVVVPESIL